MIGRLAAAVTGPRGRWVTLAAWLALGAAGFLGRARIDDVTAAGQSSFLPADAESTRALDALQHSRSAGEEVPTVIVFQRTGGLTRHDRRAIGRIGDGLNALKITGATPIVDPFSADSTASLGDVARIADGIGPISRDGEAALVVLAIDAADRGAIVAGVRTIRRYLAAHRIPGLNAYVTGPGGIAADLEQVADEAGKTLLIATLEPGPDPAAGRLPGAAAGAAAAALRRRRLHGRDRYRLPADRGRRDHGQHRGHLPAAGADLRRRHRLLAAARPPLPRGARQRAGAGASRCRRPARERPGDRRLGAAP